MKPWEEAWHPDLHGNACECPSSIKIDGTFAVADDDTVFYANDGGRARSQHGRVRLAAQAPAMARLLLAAEWDGYNGGGPTCPWCCADEPGPHKPDCALVDVLRAAGVLP